MNPFTALFAWYTSLYDVRNESGPTILGFIHALVLAVALMLIYDALHLVMTEQRIGAALPAQAVPDLPFRVPVAPPSD